VGESTFQNTAQDRKSNRSTRYNLVTGKVSHRKYCL